MSKKMIRCKACGQEIAISAKACPHCGAKNSKPFFMKWWFWAIIVILFIVIATSNNDTDNKNANNHNTNTPSIGSTQQETTKDETPVVSESTNDNGNLSTTEHDHSSKQLFDYSDFGFDNMYGLTEWIHVGESIDDVDFYFTESRPVFNIYKYYYVINFENGYIEARYFDIPETFFTGDRSKGELEDVYSYDIINPSLITMNTDRAPNLEMAVSSWNGIPLIELSISGDGYRTDFLEGVFVPTQFLDIEHSHILDDSSAVYCLVDQYSSSTDKYYTFATTLLEAIYKDFDSSVFFDALPPAISQSAREEAEANGFDWHNEFSNYKATYGDGIMWIEVRIDILHDELLVDGLKDYLNDLEEDYSINLNIDSCARAEFMLFSNDPYLYGPVTLYIAEIEGELYYLNPAGLLYPLLSNS